MTPPPPSTSLDRTEKERKRREGSKRNTNHIDWLTVCACAAHNHIYTINGLHAFHTNTNNRPSINIHITSAANKIIFNLLRFVSSFFTRFFCRCCYFFFLQIIYMQSFIHISPQWTSIRFSIYTYARSRGGGGVFRFYSFLSFHLLVLAWCFPC